MTERVAGTETLPESETGCKMIWPAWSRRARLGRPPRPRTPSSGAGGVDSGGGAG